MRNLIAAALAVFAGLAAAATPTANLALDAARDDRAAARFPESSRPLADALDPLIEDRRPTVQSQGSSPRLTVWASGIAFEAGQTVDLFAQLEDSRADASLIQQTLAALAKKPRAQGVEAEVRNAAGETLATVALRDDGKGADRLAADGVYSARWQLPAAHQPAPGRADSLLVRTAAKLADGGERVAVGGFQYSHPGARLTGRYRDALQDGSLQLLAEVDVLAPGRYHLSGTLADLLGKPLASAQAARQLDAGKHWLALDYYGLIFRELAAAGPFSLASVTLTSTVAMPNALGPVLHNSHRTGAFKLAEFTDRLFGQPDLLEAATRLERDAAR